MSERESLAPPPLRSAARPRKGPNAAAKAAPEPLVRLREGQPPAAGKVPESGGPAGPEPTRYGDWERKGRCIDF